MKFHFLFFTGAIGLSCGQLGATDSWPQFRGPDGDGIADADQVPERWSESENLAWKTELPGKGWSSPVVSSDGAIWLTTAIESTPRDDSEREKLLTAAGETEKKFKSRQIAKNVVMKALEVDLESGKLLREIDLIEVEQPDAIHTLNSYASPTPILDNGRLICHFGTFGTVCLETASGDVLWRAQFELEHNVGPGSSPFVDENRVVLICDGVDQQFVVALDKQNGEILWKTDRPAYRAASGDQKKAYSTPLKIQDKNKRNQLICMGSQWLVSYDSETGEEFWRLDHGKGFSVVPRPVYDANLGLLFLSTGFGKPELWAVRPDGTGDITGSDRVVWTEPKRIPAKPSPLAVNGMVFVISDGGIATCFDGESGSVHWTERIDGNYSASPLFADGKIYFCSHEGTITVVEAAGEFRVLAENQLDGQLMASPAALNGTLLIRSDSALYRIVGN